MPIGEGRRGKGRGEVPRTPDQTHCVAQGLRRGGEEVGRRVGRRTGGQVGRRAWGKVGRRLGRRAEEEVGRRTGED